MTDDYRVKLRVMMTWVMLEGTSLTLLFTQRFKYSDDVISKHKDKHVRTINGVTEEQLNDSL